MQGLISKAIHFTRNRMGSKVKDNNIFNFVLFIKHTCISYLIIHNLQKSNTRFYKFRMTASG